MAEILPSILSADFTRLGEEVARVERGGAKILHFDVMDGRFVPEISFGEVILRSLRPATDLHLDVHLMVDSPQERIKTMKEAGANSITVHVENTPHLHRVIRTIQGEGLKAGVALNPATPLAQLSEVLDIADIVLVMSVNPGYGGQSFIPRALLKVMDLDRIRNENGYGFVITVDGGVNRRNLAEVARAGADWLVAGSAVFNEEDPEETVREMRTILRESTLLRV